MWWLAWFLSEAAFPVSLGVAFALTVDVARRWPRRVRHYRWRNRRFLNELRSRTPDGSGPAPDRRDPQASSGPVAGGDARTPGPVAAALPPAPCPLVGAVSPAPAPARSPQRRSVLLMAEPACGYAWGSGCWFNGGGNHMCAWPASKCTGWAHRCGCGAGSSG